MSKQKSSVVLEHAISTPLFALLKSRKCVLASLSPRRKEILEKFGFAPEIVGSTFDEDLNPDSFEDIHEYPVATATQKAVEVYERLVRSDPEDAPDMVIGADTVVFTHAQPSISSNLYATQERQRQELLEKPRDKDDQLRMLLDLNGSICEVVTGISVVYPILTSPGYEIKSIDERTLVHFCDNPQSLLKAYVESGEGLDRAGGFAIQGLGGLLIRKIDGDYNNVVGFPAASFFQLLELMTDDDGDFLTL